MMRGEDLTVVLNSARTVLENGARNAFAAPFIWKFAMLPGRVSSAFFAFFEGGGLQFVSCEA